VQVRKMMDLSPYKEMYLTMFRAARDAVENREQAGQILIEAMQKCEEMYISADDKDDQ